MIRCLIVDDEPNAHLVLKNYIDRTESLHLSGQCYHVNEALEILEKDQFDVVFLDINMPDLSGFNLMQSDNYKHKTILTTAYSEYALESYEYGVLDYLLKPFSYPRFLQALDRYRDITGEVRTNHTIAMKVDGNLIEFDTRDIVYLQSWGNYVKLFTKEDSFICSSTTTEAERNLPREQFVRIHKSYVVNIDFIDQFDVDYIILKNQSYLPVGITYRRLLSGLIS